MAGNCCDFGGGCGDGLPRRCADGTGRVVRPYFLSFRASPQTGVGIRLPKKRKTDCRVATLLAMTARRCRADGTPSHTGGAMWASSPTERRRGVPYRRRSQDMLATARPPMRTVTAPSFSYRTLRISDGRDMCSPCRNTFSSPGFTSPRR